MNCVVCSEPMTAAGKTFTCDCGGTWVHQQMFANMLAEHGLAKALEWRPRDGTHRPCPVCKSDMANVYLGQAELDRCEPHGIWFDVDELEDVLGKAPSVVAPVATSTAASTASSFPVSADEAAFFRSDTLSSPADVSVTSSGSGALAILGLLFDLLGALADD